MTNDDNYGAYYRIREALRCIGPCSVARLVLKLPEGFTEQWVEAALSQMMRESLVATVGRGLPVVWRVTEKAYPGPIEVGAPLAQEIKMKDEAPVNPPKHRTSHPSGVECIQIAEHLNFNLGNALTYIWRADLKGNATEDLEKAAFYINRELKRRMKCQTAIADVL